MIEYSVEEIQATMRHLGVIIGPKALWYLVKSVRTHNPDNLSEWLRNTIVDDQFNLSWLVGIDKDGV